MHAVTRLILFAAMLSGVLSIAATLFIEYSRDKRRQRLVKNVEAALANRDFERPETLLKRVA